MATPAQLAEKVRQDRAGLERSIPRPTPPPLPPRAKSAPAPPPPASPPPYSFDDAERGKLISEQWHSDDPRSSSTLSLVPSESGEDGGRRTLLLIYIHGFMGNETSFQSFPAHVHNLLTIALAETHAVHTKIYPRYQSRKAINFARDDFSTWLEPHENRHTDVILLGHSMGGILSAEVALKPSDSPANGKPFQHRILGTINFDTPFLGMHPGVVVSGIGSLFRPAPEPPKSNQWQSSTSGTDTPYGSDEASTSSQSHTPSMANSENSSQLSLVQSLASSFTLPSPKDPFFNPAFPNDVRRPERTGLSSVLHFINKHSDGLASATKQYFMSHLEFGGCLADYPGLKNRYERLRALEDVVELAGRDRPGYGSSTRCIRFVNYYTASTGRVKAPKTPSGQTMDQGEHLEPMEAQMKDMSLEDSESHSSTLSPSLSSGEQTNGVTTPQQVGKEPDASAIKAQMQDLGENSGIQDDVQEPPEMRHIDSVPIDDDEEPPVPVAIIESTETELEATPPQSQPSSIQPPLPPLPEVPTEPELIDLSLYTDKDSRKIAEKEQKRVMKVYQQAVKDRENAIKDRRKLLEKREKKARQEREKAVKAEEKQRLKEEKEGEKHEPAPPQHVEREREESTASSSTQEKPKRDKKFCMLPPGSGGKRDRCWVRVYMEGVDEVGAHCGLFFPGPQYESLVGDVGARVEDWVRKDAERRRALEMRA